MKKKKTINLLVWTLVCATFFVGCEANENADKSDGEAVSETSNDNDAYPEFMGEYRFGMTRSEGASVEKPTTLYNRPLDDASPYYDEIADELHSIHYTFADGTRLDSVIDSLIETMGINNDYRHIDHEGYDGAYVQDIYYWSDDYYAIELRYTENLWSRTEKKQRELNLFIRDKTYDPGRPYSSSK